MKLIAGLPILIAVQSTTWEAEAEERSKDLKQFFEAQLNAYELVIDYVAGQTPISAAFVRELHRELCKYQETYRVLTALGFQVNHFQKVNTKSMRIMCNSKMVLTSPMRQ